MTYLWNWIRNLAAVAGFLMAFLAAGTWDYYTQELQAPMPEWVWSRMIAGIALMIPTVVHLIRKGQKDESDM